MKFQYDLIVIGLGPAGMAATIMGHAMGLKVCAIEAENIGGECMNVGCIPSKALLRIAKNRHLNPALNLSDSFNKINDYIEYIRDKKTSSMFQGITILKYLASFIDNHTVQVGAQRVTAKRIFIATGTQPFIPPIPGIKQVDYLTNNNLFKLKEIPKSMIILGGGAIGIEMAQAFARLGTQCHVVHADQHIIPNGDPEAAELLTNILRNENINIHNGQQVSSISVSNQQQIQLTCNEGLELTAEKLLVATGRAAKLNSIALDKIGIALDNKGFIKVNSKLQTNRSNIYAVGDCNGYSLFSHAAMHQSMLGLINCLLVSPMKFNFRNYVVPWTVFTDPQFAQVGMSESELIAKKIKFSTLKSNYQDYGAAIAEEVGVGFVKVFVSSCGRIYGAVIIGEGAGEMIQEWAYAIQYKINISKIMFLQHSFPTMSFLNKRIAETWMMQKMQPTWVKKVCRFLFKLG